MNNITPNVVPGSWPLIVGVHTIWNGSHGQFWAAEVVVTTKDGLWWYQLNDTIEVTGFILEREIPLIRYVECKGYMEQFLLLVLKLLILIYIGILCQWQIFHRILPSGNYRFIDWWLHWLDDRVYHPTMLNERNKLPAYGFLVKLNGNIGMVRLWLTTPHVHLLGSFPRMKPRSSSRHRPREAIDWCCPSCFSLLESSHLSIISHGTREITPFCSQQISAIAFIYDISDTFKFRPPPTVTTAMFLWYDTLQYERSSWGYRILKTIIRASEVWSSIRESLINTRVHVT